MNTAKPTGPEVRAPDEAGDLAAPLAGSVATTGDPTQPVVRIRGLRKSFGSLEVLHGIDLDVHAGEHVVGDRKSVV